MMVQPLRLLQRMYQNDRAHQVSGIYISGYISGFRGRGSGLRGSRSTELGTEYCIFSIRVIRLHLFVIQVSPASKRDALQLMSLLGGFVHLQVTIGWEGGPATIGWEGGPATIGREGGPATIGWEGGPATMGREGGPATIGWEGGPATIHRPRDQCQTLGQR